ncbi:branched-chain amino acid ABC transporter permease [Pelodictyon phaeoclathratiforme]|uniref:Inner-membrane translocator n=1 Tax=Pelodictyon phaeoclathratiforme (strain DSM 5477 / BU-1) TaxID=324925 RepID=B4SCM1_PELPB|nr:branched-chain amino acid ABC transporter permease [Pelodictyon phaeoclathratiforme]ACF44226.1 inner-membrane translocator [Pelodictyon phaeoclathratiforme BU-1]
MEYILHLLIIVSIYVMLSQSLSLTAGFAGMISLAHAGFYGIGAYTTALLSINYQMPFIYTLFFGILICGIIAMLVSIIALRTIDDYFIICTLGIQIVIFTILNNWMSLTNGPMGIMGIPSISVFQIDFSNKLSFLILSIIFSVVIFIFIKLIVKSSFGRVLKALSEDEIYTQSVGKNVYLSKVIAFTISSMIAAIPGALYAHYTSFVDPSSFTVNESIFILSIVIIGGMRNLWGIIFAAAFLVLLPEALRFVGLPNNIAANLRQIIYGIILILVIFKSTTPQQSYGV